MASILVIVFACLGLSSPAFGYRAEEAEGLELKTEGTAPTKGACWEVGFEEGGVTAKKYPDGIPWPTIDNNGHPCTREVGTVEKPNCAGISTQSMEYAVEGEEALKKICEGKSYEAELTVYVPQEMKVCLMSSACGHPGTVTGYGDYWMKYPADVARKCTDGCGQVNRVYRKIAYKAKQERKASKLAAEAEERTTKANQLREVLQKPEWKLNMCNFAPGDDSHPWELSGTRQVELRKELEAAGVKLPPGHFNNAIKTLKTDLAADLSC